MDKELLKQIIVEWQEFSFPKLITRDYKIPLDSNKIVTITGPRRSGKTSLIFILIQELLKKSIKRDQIIFINFDDPRLIPFDASGIENLLESYRELYPKNMDKTNYIFFDEIQNVINWESAIRRLYDTQKFKIFLTGSSSKMLGKEIATNLRGRTINYEILPFSFKEILRAKGIELDKNTIYSKKRFEIINILNTYFEYGGFPEIVLEKNDELKIRILREYLETTFLKDLVERYNIKNQKLMRELIRYLATNISTDFSINSFFKWVKQIYPITKRTLINYVEYLEDINLFFLIKKYSPSIKQQILAPRKNYIVDIGFRNIYGFRFSNNTGRVLENTIFLELKQKKIRNPLMELLYWRNHKKHEVDFVIKKENNIELLIQVCTDLSDFKTKEREIKALVEASNELDCNNVFIITLDYDGEEKVGNKKIVYIPAWKWLIE